MFGAFITGPFFAKLKIDSLFEYIEMRYKTNAVRLVAMTFYLIKSYIGCAIYILGPSTVLNLILGLETYESIALIFTITTFYTCIGGIKAVIWTDLFQAIIMVLFLSVLVGKGIADAGGLSEIIRISGENGRLNLFEFNPDPFVRQSFWSLCILSIFTQSRFILCANFYMFSRNFDCFLS